MVRAEAAAAEFEEKSAGIDAKPTTKPQKYRLEIPPIAVPLAAG
jgi:hypothetical protein